MIWLLRFIAILLLLTSLGGYLNIWPFFVAIIALSVLDSDKWLIGLAVVIALVFNSLVMVISTVGLAIILSILLTPLKKVLITN